MSSFSSLSESSLHELLRNDITRILCTTFQQHGRHNNFSYVLRLGKAFRSLCSRGLIFHKNDCKIQKKKTFKTFLLENLLSVSLDHHISGRQCHQLSHSTVLRCQFTFYKQCSEAHFTCHVNPLSLRRDTNIASLDRSLILADILQQRDFTVFLFAL